MIDNPDPLRNIRAIRNIRALFLREYGEDCGLIVARQIVRAVRESDEDGR